MSELHSEETVRQRVLKGGYYLTVRRGVSLFLQLIGVTLVTRAVGPEAYGLFHAASSLFTFIHMIIFMRINVYLIRERILDFSQLLHLAFWWLLLVGTIGAGLSVVGVALAGTFWVQREGFIPVALSLCAALPLALIVAVPQSILERELEYRRTTFIEIGSQLATYAFAIPLAQMGYGVWALVAGFWAAQLVQLSGFFGATRYRPRWYWNREHWREMMRYSFSLSLSTWLASVRNLMPSMVLLPYAGEQAVGYYALTERLVSMLGFVKDAAGRIAIPAFARVQDDHARLLRALTEGIQLQVLAMGIFFAGFALVAPLVLPLLLGGRWEIPLLMWVFSLSAARVQISGIFALQGSALAVKKYNWVSVRGNIIFAIVLLGSSYAAVVWLPAPYKLFGFLIADMFAHLCSYLYKNQFLRRYIGTPDYRVALLWLVTLLCALFAPVISWWLYVPALLLVAHPYSLQTLRSLYLSLRGRSTPHSGN